jgi:hypothetical protein
MREKRAERKIRDLPGRSVATRRDVDFLLNAGRFSGKGYRRLQEAAIRKVGGGVVLSLALLGFVAPPISAQTPAPKVTITGLLDLVTSASKNWIQLDPTNANDQEWYSRERGRVTVTGEVGQTKAVWAIEMDFSLGCTNAASAAPVANASATGGCAAHPGTTQSLDMDTDVASALETKWLYVETPFTGPGSILPFIPVRTTLRAGAQPARGHEYKIGILLSGDFPGVTLETTWAPNIRSTLTYIQIGEQLEPVGFPGATEDWAILASVEVDVSKGLTVKPTYAYASYYGGNTGAGNLGTEAKNGFTVNVAPGGVVLETTRHTIGGDVRWAIGGFSLQPTFLFQWGEQSVPPALADGKSEVDILAWIFDVIAGYRLGPLNISGRFMYTPGMEATDCVTSAGQCPAGRRGQDIHYYQSIDTGFDYMVGWSEIQTSGVDYASALLAGAPGVSLRQSPSFDKYGRIWVELGADYAVTPALTLKGLVNTSWAAEKVDTNGVLSSTGITSPTGGDDRHLLTELNLGFTYRFAPNVAFDMVGAYAWAHDALRNAAINGGPARQVHDIYKATARVRITF